MLTFSCGVASPVRMASLTTTWDFFYFLFFICLSFHFYSLFLDGKEVSPMRMASLTTT